MGIEARRQYFERVQFRYRNSTKAVKGRILDEFCEVCRFNRKYAIRLLSRCYRPFRKRPGPKPVYDRVVAEALSRLWFEMERINSKRMVEAIPDWLGEYRGKDLSGELRQKLIAMSAATIDRLLRPWRKKARLRGLCTTKPGSLLKNRIPIQTVNWNIKSPGFIEADTVAHCGNSLSGSFANSITMTDLHCAWTENRAVWTKGTHQMLEQIRDIEENLPFPMLGFDCDNGSEFLNYALVDYFQLRKKGQVHFTRSRPYKKNDNAHVEQKNWTHVRRVFGYDRFDSEVLVGMMNEIYKECWNPLHNFFIPSIKLTRKERVGARIKKYYDKPKTPYQRLLDCPTLPNDQKEKLRAQRKKLNPFDLRQCLVAKLERFALELEKHRRTKIAA